MSKVKMCRAVSYEPTEMVMANVSMRGKLLDVAKTIGT
jgi:hypothetical protein